MKARQDQGNTTQLVAESPRFFQWYLNWDYMEI